jgi:hypothetical protein
VPQDIDAINAAVRECIANSTAADNPASAVLECLKALRAKGWTEAEVAFVRAAVTRYFRELAGDVENDAQPLV